MKKDYGHILTQRKFLASKVVQFLLENFKTAKIPSYAEIYYKYIEISLIIVSTKAIDRIILIRDEKLLQKYTDITILLKQLLSKTNNNQLSNQVITKYPN